MPLTFSLLDHPKGLNSVFRGPFGGHLALHGQLLAILGSHLVSLAAALWALEGLEEFGCILISVDGLGGRC